MVVFIEIFKDAVSDFTGGAGVLAMSIPAIVDVNDYVKLICSIGGAILLYFSIRYKILLYKDLKRKQEEEKIFRK